MTVYERQRLFDGAANGRWVVGGCLSTRGYSLLTTGFNAAFVRVSFPVAAAWPRDPWKSCGTVSGFVYGYVCVFSEWNVRFGMWTLRNYRCLKNVGIQNVDAIASFRNIKIRVCSKSKGFSKYFVLVVWWILLRHLKLFWNSWRHVLRNFYWSQLVMRIIIWILCIKRNRELWLICKLLVNLSLCFFYSN